MDDYVDPVVGDFIKNKWYDNIYYVYAYQFGTYILYPIQNRYVVHCSKLDMRRNHKVIPDGRILLHNEIVQSYNTHSGLDG